MNFSPTTFKDIYDIVVARARVNNSVRPEEELIFKGIINQAYTTLAMSYQWGWRKKTWDIILAPPITTGTSSVVSGSREVTVTGYTVTKEILGRSVRFNDEIQIYRIIGVKQSSSKIYLSANFIGTTDTEATHKIYQHEHTLPPDCDIIGRPYYDLGKPGNSFSSFTEISDNDPLMKPIDEHDFSRETAVNSNARGKPEFYCESEWGAPVGIPNLSEMILGYDFLTDEDFKYKRVKFFPLDPGENVLVHIPYFRSVQALFSDDQQPEFPKLDRWVIVDAALEIYFGQEGQQEQAAFHARRVLSYINKLTGKIQKTSKSPRLVVNLKKMRRTHYFNNLRR
jgi:hypothetical protein